MKARTIGALAPSDSASEYNRKLEAAAAALENDHVAYCWLHCRHARLLGEPGYTRGKLERKYGVMRTSLGLSHIPRQRLMDLLLNHRPGVTPLVCTADRGNGNGNGHTVLTDDYRHKCAGCPFYEPNGIEHGDLI